MSANELLLLGLLDERSRHGYELHEFLERRLHFVSDLKKPTAYRLLDRLYSQGFVSRELEREGRRPERMVYRLTDSGRTRFEQLLRAQLARATHVLDPGNVALLFCDRLPAMERVALLEGRRQEAIERRSQLASLVFAHAARTPARVVLEHDLVHIDAEIAWLDRTIESLKESLVK